MALELAELEERAFEDGEHKTRALTSVESRNAVVFHALYGDDERSVNDKLCRLLFFCGALKDAGARHVQVVAPYLCYARKASYPVPGPDHHPLRGGVVRGLSGDRLTTFEVHNLAAFDNAFRIPTRHIESAELFAAHFTQLPGDVELVAVSPMPAAPSVRNPFAGRWAAYRARGWQRLHGEVPQQRHRDRNDAGRRRSRADRDHR